LASVEELFFLKQIYMTQEKTNNKTFIEILATTIATFNVASIKVEHT
jgi:hypothetical protein